jgi:hypothetical protein
MMGKLLILLLFFLVPWRAMPQDERYFRQLFSGELLKGEVKTEAKKYSYTLHTPFYALDLNHDSNPEFVIFVKKDSEDWVEIFEQIKGERKKVFSYRFETKGFNSELFKIEFKRISPKTSVLIMYYYEGMSKYTEMDSSSRIYVATLDNDDLKSLSMFKGPSFFEEHKSLKGHYHIKNYQVYLQDLNNDIIKELVVKHHLVSQVFFYEGSGKWKTFNN